MTRAELLALAARVEAAPGADKMLDAEVAVAATPGLFSDGGYVGFTGRGDMRPPPAYTSSLDAAASLVDDGWEWSVCRACGEHSPMRHFGGRNGGCYDANAGPWGSPKRATAATPALALTAAALRARAQEAGDE